jgi:hypothetical protein
MIRPGKRVQIRAICKRDAFATSKYKNMLTGKCGAVVDKPLRFDPIDATFSGTLKLDNLEDELYFSSIQVKKLYRRNQSND